MAGPALLGYVNAAAVGLALLLAAFSLRISFLSRRRKSPQGEAEVYQDQDGVASEDSLKAYSIRGQNIALLLFTLLGLSACLIEAILVTIRHPAGTSASWAAFGLWAILAGQTALVVTERQPVACFNLAALSLTVFSIVATNTSLELYNDETDGSLKRMWWKTLFDLARLALSVGGALTCTAYPRRPAVYHEGKPVDAEHTASIWSRYNFLWPVPLLYRARSGKKLEMDDYPHLSHYSRAQDLFDHFNALTTTGSFAKRLFVAHGPQFTWLFILAVVDAVLNLAPQFVMYNLLLLLQQRDSGIDVSYLPVFWAVGLGFAQLLEGYVFSRVWWAGDVYIQIPLRMRLPALIFAKSMRKKDIKGVQKKDQAESTDGKDSTAKLEEQEVDEAEELKKTRQGVVNLVGVDANRVGNFCSISHMMVGSVFRLGVAFTFLTAVAGWQSVLAGTSVQLAFLPINIYYSRVYNRAQDALMKARDAKLALVNEALTGIRQIKFSGLEDKWEKKILASRQRELDILWKTLKADIALFFLWITGPVFLSATCIGTHAVINGGLQPSVAFTTISILSQIEVTLSFLPELTTIALDAWVSLKRIAEYLDTSEKVPFTVPGKEVSFEQATMSWPAETPDIEAFKLHDITVTFPAHELSVISGRTGSGKSLLLSAILGEAELISGSVTVPEAPNVEERNDAAANKGNWILPNAVAYVPQIPWIENNSFRGNILSGLPFDEERYNRVIEACALKKDLEILIDGDTTEIGPKGINLSGGQCWRLTLARALYSRAGILIMDDIFSAVDAHVGRHIFENALTGDICSGRTRILVTHHVGLVRHMAKYEVQLGDGGVMYAGNVEDLGKIGALKTPEDDPTIAVEDVAEDTLDKIERQLSRVSRTLSKSSTRPVLEDAQVESEAAKLKNAKKFVEEEERETGRVSFAMYAEYLKACGGWLFWSSLIGLFIGFEALELGRSWTLRLWTQHYQYQSLALPKMAHGYVLQKTVLDAESTVSAKQTDDLLWFYLPIYLGVSLAMSIQGTLRFGLVFKGSLKASRETFTAITYTVLRAPIRWLDTVPVGRILNRFTADFNAIDTRLAYGFTFTMWNALQVIGVGIAGTIVSPWISVIIVLVIAISVYYAVFYLAAARDTRRLESTIKSPIFEHYTQALQGISTIRAFDRAAEYTKTMFTRLDRHGQILFHMHVFKRWLGWQLNVVGSIFATIIAIVIVQGSNMDASLGGFALTFALSYTNLIFWSLRNYVELELGMNSIERIVEYTTMETEKQGGVDVPAMWPTEGRLEVDDLVVSYAKDLPPVLKNLTFTVEPRQRVGVVGRTGAGKSSLTLALFRFLEAKQGTIHIDGIDISTVKVQDLRSRLAIIPQDPVLFSGTVRSNLDPFDEHEDYELKEALSRVHLTSDSPPTPDPSGSGTLTPDRNAQNVNVFDSLASAISEGGQNLSQGQRQLLCLARAIVARPKMMVLDEATSAVDKTTDALIQRSIRDGFGGATLVVIAHRLSTIADFDRIMVLDEGRIVEYDSPKVLFEKKDGIFRGMVESSGERDVLVDVILKDGAE